MAILAGPGDVYIGCANFADSSAAAAMIGQLEERRLGSLHLLSHDDTWPTDESLCIVFVGRSGWGRGEAEAAGRLNRARTWVVIANELSPEDRATTGDLFPETPTFELAREGALDDLAARIASDQSRYRRETPQATEGDEAAASRRADMLRTLLSRQVITPLEINDPSPLAEAILVRAAHPRFPGASQGELSTTSLLISIAEVGRLSGPDELTPCRAVTEFFERFPHFNEMKETYLRSKGSFEGRIDELVATPNMQAILRAAANSGRLTADNLVHALLDRTGTAVMEWLEKSGIPFGALRAAVEPLAAATKTAPTTPSPSPSPSGSPPPAFDISLASVDTDSPDQGAPVDRLHVEDEAKAFARIATARQVKPPLAFGVFGDWGSGKSFFMRLMQNHVDLLASGRAQEFDDKLFHKNTVQIRFNAWHYVDTNLWASLIDHIFVELDRWAIQKRKPAAQNTLFDKLATARELTFESAERLMRRRREQKDAVDKLEKARQDLAVARDRASKSAGTAWATAKRMFWTPERQRDIAKLAQSLGLAQAAQDMEHFEAALKELRDQGTRARVEADAFRKRLWSAPWLIATLAAITLVPLAAVAGREWLLEYAQAAWVQALLKNINETALGLGGALAAATGAVKWASVRVGWGINRIQGMQKDLDSAIAQQIKQDQKSVTDAEEALKKQTTQVAEAEAVLASTREKLAEAAREYASGTGRARLLHFVRDRVTGGQYAKHLGLVATARKDFTELSAMMSEPDRDLLATQQNELEVFRKRVEALKELAKTDGLLTDAERTQLDEAAAEPNKGDEPTFERIILYVDDLDRCPPKVVVAVLQAVHLLLTFPLFVVVVAVDTRWVSRSLVTHYNKLLDPGAARKGQKLEAAAPRDYLEKIFQVPYRVRPMTDKASSDLVGGLVDPRPIPVTPPPPPPPPPPAPPPTPPGAPAGAAAPSPPATTPPAPAATKPTAPPASPTVPPTPGSPAPNPSGTPAGTAATKRQVAGALVLTPEERAFMRALAPLVGDTPRRALRFVNVYRVIKASLDATDLHAIREFGAYRALMTELAVTTGVPELQEKWWSFVDQIADIDSGKLVWAKAKTPDWFIGDTRSEGRLGSILDLLISNPRSLEPKGPPVEQDIAVRTVVEQAGKHLRYYSSIARRYSFRD